MKLSRLLTQEQHDFLVKHVPGRYNKELAELINTEFGLELNAMQIKNYKRNHKLAYSGLTGQFEQGHIPMNKGTKGLFNVGGNHTSFKKGHVPKNYKPVGYERVDKDGYILIKVQDEGKWYQRWKHKSKVIWERRYGAIPKGKTLIYKDGNRLNCTLDNLKLVTRNELLRMNRLRINRTSAEITETAYLLAQIQIRNAELRKKKGKLNETR